MPKDETIATVGKIVQGKHGPYAVAHNKEIGVITFALKKSIWHEVDDPTPGTEVVLADIRKKVAGWRAMSARFFRPTDATGITERRSKQ